MSITLSIIIFFEVVFIMFIAWGFMHEEKFVAFEDKIIRKILKAIRKKKIKLATKWLSKEGIIIKK